MANNKNNCDDDIIFEEYIKSKINETFDMFEDSSSDIDNIGNVSDDISDGVDVESMAEDEETKDFEQIKDELTEDEAMEYFRTSDMFHQTFHRFMEINDYIEKKNKDGKEMWIKQH